MRKIFVISDTHLGHKNILKFVDSAGAYVRRFDSIEEHDEHIVDNWNSVVSSEDIVYHLGDVFFGDGWKHLPKLHGRKRLVLGNHDDGKKRCIQNNFQKVVSSRMFREYGAILTHRPIWIPDDDRYPFNIHGHIHQNQSPTQYHINVSCEAVSYTPVDIELLIERKKSELS